MSACARFILVNYKQDLLGENTVDNTVDQKIALPFYVMLILHLVIWNLLKQQPSDRVYEVHLQTGRLNNWETLSVSSTLQCDTEIKCPIIWRHHSPQWHRHIIDEIWAAGGHDVKWHPMIPNDITWCPMSSHDALLHHMMSRDITSYVKLE